jgi:hypothetical protein
MHRIPPTPAQNPRVLHSLASGSLSLLHTPEPLHDRSLQLAGPGASPMQVGPEVAVTNGMLMLSGVDTGVEMPTLPRVQAPVVPLQPSIVHGLRSFWQRGNEPGVVGEHRTPLVGGTPAPGTVPHVAVTLPSNVHDACRCVI